MLSMFWSWRSDETSRTREERSGCQPAAVSAQFAFPGFGKPQKVVCLGFAKTGMTASSSKLNRRGTMRMHFRFVNSKGCAIREETEVR